MQLIPKQQVIVCVGVGTPEQTALNTWLKNWGPFLRFRYGNEACRRCVDIYCVEALSDVISKIPPGVIVKENWSNYAEIEALHCRCDKSEISETERLLFEAALDAFYNLWDGNLTVTEFRSIHVAMTETLRRTRHFTVFEETTAEIDKILLSGMSPEMQHNIVRGAICDLAHYIGRQI